MTFCSTTTCTSTARTSRKSRTVWRRCPAQSSRMSSVSARIRMRCRSATAFISEHDLEAIEVANTAIAAQNVQKKGDKQPCCHLLAARRLSGTACDILAEGINDMQHNETRFIAVSRTLTCQPEDNRIEIAFHIPECVGYAQHRAGHDRALRHRHDRTSTRVRSRTARGAMCSMSISPAICATMRCSPCCISFMRSFPTSRSSAAISVPIRTGGVQTHANPTLRPSAR